MRPVHGATVLALTGLVILQVSNVVLTADAEQADFPVSLTRIRHALEQAPNSRLTLPKKEADFRVEVQENKPDFKTVLGSLDFRAGPVLRQHATQLGTPPLIEVNVLPLAGSLATAVRHARRARAEKAAQAEVQSALREFCATHACSGDR